MTHFFVRLFFSFHFCDYFHTMSWQREADEKEFLNKRPLRWFVLVSGRITTVCRGLYSARPAIYHSKSKMIDTHTNIDIEIFFPDSFSYLTGLNVCDVFRNNQQRCWKWFIQRCWWRRSWFINERGKSKDYSFFALLVLRLWLFHFVMIVFLLLSGNVLLILLSFQLMGQGIEAWVYGDGYFQKPSLSSYMTQYISTVTTYVGLQSQKCLLAVLSNMQPTQQK